MQISNVNLKPAHSYPNSRGHFVPLKELRPNMHFIYKHEHYKFLYKTAAGAAAETAKRYRVTLPLNTVVRLRLKGK